MSLDLTKDIQDAINQDYSIVDAEGVMEEKVKELLANREDLLRINKQLEEELKQRNQNNLDLQEEFYKQGAKINELKAENARLEAELQERRVEPVKHGWWIPCSERMPETLTETLDEWQSECCLVFAEETEWIGMAYYRTNNNKSWWEFADAQNKPKIDWAEITHWMPLPNCPNCGAKMYGGAEDEH